MTAWLHDRRPVAVAILIYTGWNAQSLVAAWRHAPYDRLGWLAFALWAALLLNPRLRGAGPRTGWLFAAALVSFAGRVGDLSVATHLGLALAFMALARPGWAGWIWLAGAVAWVPATGYALRTLGPCPVVAMRLVLVTGANALAWTVTRRTTSGESRYEQA